MPAQGRPSLSSCRSSRRRRQPALPPSIGPRSSIPFASWTSSRPKNSNGSRPLRGPIPRTWPAFWCSEKKLTRYQAGALLQGKARGLLIGQYLVLDKLGVGGGGVVFKARAPAVGAGCRPEDSPPVIRARARGRPPVPSRVSDRQPLEPSEPRRGDRGERGPGRPLPDDGVYPRLRPRPPGVAWRPDGDQVGPALRYPGGPRAGGRPCAGRHPPRYQAGQHHDRPGRAESACSTSVWRE